MNLFWAGVNIYEVPKKKQSNDGYKRKKGRNRGKGVGVRGEGD